ncbi:hypothetical protein NLI96_g11449 [Meripilus lineatus]|uniref:Enolase C-terminal domain-like protein n=1 Tax=Meripilus lineatus TaxID=2056292 RepID=A0AAD5URX1_9APHY|nr:hypothetical protein NLI96_g11449 [Physisporinus lineatus]
MPSTIGFHHRKHRGWGESTLEGHTEAVEGAVDALRQTFCGWEAGKIQDIWQHGYRSKFYRGGPVLMSAISGLDIALWDIKGKKLGVPIWQLLGGNVRDKVKVYGWIGGDTPQDVYEGALERSDQGFTVVKMNGTGSVDWVDSPSVLSDAMTRVNAVKQLGLDVGIDFHGRLHKGMAKQLAKLLEPLQPIFIEGISLHPHIDTSHPPVASKTEPLLPSQPQEIADLAQMVSTPIALGERLFTRHEFRPYLEKRAIDIAQPDVSHCGGISELHRIASLTEMYDVALAPHCPLGPIALAACLQVDIATPNFMIQEMSWQMHYNQGADLLTYLNNPEVFAVKEGYVDILQGPGLGIEVNEALVREMAKKYADESPWRNEVFHGPDGSLREW